MYLLLIENQGLQQSESLLVSLEQFGHDVDVAHTPQAAATQTARFWPNLVILNVASSVAEFQKAIDEVNLNVPHLIVSDFGDQNSTVGKNAAVISTEDIDHIDKSIDTAVAGQKDRFFRLPDLVIDFNQRQVLRGGQIYSLTPKEIKLLRLLIENGNEVMSRKAIMQNVWETDYMGDTRTLDVHIRWLREKIENNPSRPERLITIRGVGYRFFVPKSE
jgi:DNA-binding response OmpR family regulator